MGIVEVLFENILPSFIKHTFSHFFRRPYFVSRLCINFDNDVVFVIT